MKELEVLEQYDINIKSTRKIRGAIWCDTSQGVYVLKEIQLSTKRIPALYGLYQYIKERGYQNVDGIVKNKEEELWSESEEGNHYVLKKWYYGKECDNKRSRDILEAVRNLARLHQVMKGYCSDRMIEKPSLQEELERHNRELRKVRSFVRGKTGKCEFECAFLKCFETMYEWADVASKKLSNLQYKELEMECQNEGWILHGDYNYHNILMTESGIATTNFEHFCSGVPITDFYYFLRKTMEKNQWDVNLGRTMLEEYEKIQPVSEVEKQYLAIMLAYPEKFWKVANTYFRSRKSWISSKSVEKLELSIRQTEEKNQFLQTIFSFSI